MAVETGTATSNTDLWDKLLAFLTTNADLVAAGQAWTQSWSLTAGAIKHVVVEGPVPAAGTKPMVGLRFYPSQYTAEETTISVSGCTGLSATATHFADHTNSLVRFVQAFVANSTSMAYWFVANGRRFIAVWRIGTVYQAIHGGFMLPYGVPSSHPYPLFIGGTRGFADGSSGIANRGQPTSYTSATLQHSMFAIPSGLTSYSATDNVTDTSACILRPGMTWADVTAKGGISGYAMPRARMSPFLFQKFAGPDGGYNNAGTRGVIPLNDNSGDGNYDSTISTLGYREVRSRLIAGLDGEFPLTRLSVFTPQTSQTGDYASTHGVLDGVYSLPGIGNSVENIVTYDGVDHIVFPNVYLSGSMDFWALALE